MGRPAPKRGATRVAKKHAATRAQARRSLTNQPGSQRGGGRAALPCAPRLRRSSARYLCGNHGGSHLRLRVVQMRSNFAIVGRTSDFFSDFFPSVTAWQGRRDAARRKSWRPLRSAARAGRWPPAWSSRRPIGGRPNESLTISKSARIVVARLILEITPRAADAGAKASNQMEVGTNAHWRGFRRHFPDRVR